MFALVRPICISKQTVEPAYQLDFALVAFLSLLARLFFWFLNKFFVGFHIRMHTLCFPLHQHRAKLVVGNQD
jgi:hypothetical protein